MEENKTIRRRFNLFDVAIIALVLAVLAAAMLLRDRSAGAERAGDTMPIRYTVELKKAPQDMANQIKVGEPIYRSTDNAYLGKVVEVRHVPHVENEFAPLAGRFVRYEVPERSDVYITIEGDGYSTAQSLVVESLTPRVGGELPVKGKGYAFAGYICGIDTMDAPLVENTEVGIGELEATYIVLMDDMREMLLDSVHEGDRLYDKTSGALLGTIEEIWTEPYGETHLAADGQPVYAEKEGVYSQFLRVRGRAVEKSDGYYLDGGAELKIGASPIMNSRFLERAGIFYALEEIK